MYFDKQEAHLGWCLALDHLAHPLVAWKFTSTIPGELCAMITLTVEKLLLYVTSWDFQLTTAMKGLVLHFGRYTIVIHTK